MSEHVPPYTDVVIDLCDVALYDLPTCLPGLIRIELLPDRKCQLTFATAPGCAPADPELIRSEVERITAKRVLHWEQRWEGTIALPDPVAARFLRHEDSHDDRGIVKELLSRGGWKRPPAPIGPPKTGTEA